LFQLTPSLKESFKPPLVAIQLGGLFQEIDQLTDSKPKVPTSRQYGQELLIAGKAIDVPKVR
jgi:hypothetical protein